MGIDIYARWKNQTEDQKEAQSAAWLSITSGHLGYLREAYQGEPYATIYLCLEAFAKGYKAPIAAEVLRERLPRTLVLAEERERNIYQSNEEMIEKVKQSYRDFVALCEKMEKETDEPVVICASY